MATSKGSPACVAEYAISAPSMSSEPWAKLMRFVTPKISEKPIATMA